MAALVGWFQCGRGRDATGQWACPQSAAEGHPRSRGIRDGRSLYYVAERTVYEAGVRAGDAFASATPVRLYSVARDISSFDVTPHGKRFLFLRQPPPGFLPVQVIVNWRAP